MKILQEVSEDSFWDKIVYKYWEIVPYDWRLGQIKYRLKSYFWSKFWKVNPKHIPKDGWVDRCALLPHYMFQILIDFLDKECNPGHVEWYGEDPHTVEVNGIKTNVMDEMKELRRWWEEEYLPYYHDDDKSPVVIAWNKVHDCRLPEEYLETEDPRWVEMKFNYSIPEEEAKALIKNAADIEYKFEEEIKNRMHRLVNIYRYMWT